MSDCHKLPEVNMFNIILQLFMYLIYESILFFYFYLMVLTNPIAFIFFSLIKNIDMIDIYAMRSLYYLVSGSRRRIVCSRDLG